MTFDKNPFDSNISLPIPNNEEVIMPSVFGQFRQKSGLKRPIFVVGSPRSGTTVLGSCLAANKDLSGSDESLFLLDMWRIASDLHSGSNRRGWAPLQKYISTEQLREAIGEFSDNIFNALVVSQGKQRYVDHTPWYVACIPMLYSLYHDCIVIHIIRDGRHVTCSLQKAYSSGFEWAGQYISDSARLWSYLVNLGIEYGRTKHARHYLELRYEDLCLEPETFLKKLCIAIDVEWDNCMLKPLAKAHATPSRKNATIATLNENNTLTINQVQEIEDWPKEWSPSDRKAFLDSAGETMTQLAYQ